MYTEIRESGTPEPRHGARELNQTASLEVRAHLARQRLKRHDIANVLGVSLRTVSDLLGNRRPWRMDEVEIVSAWLDVSPGELMFPPGPKRR